MEGIWKRWIGKKVFIILKNNRQYSGTILEVDDKSQYLVWIVMRDKFDREVTFNEGEIELIQEEE